MTKEQTNQQVAAIMDGAIANLNKALQVANENGYIVDIDVIDAPVIGMRQQLRVSHTVMRVL